jgi:hypothetical protein
MTPNEINRAIAESMGWVRRPENPPHWGFKWKDPDGEVWCFLPNYHNDLNAIHEAVKTLQDQDAFLRELQFVTEEFTSVDADGDDEWLWYSVTATAPQRCEAYLKTIGKWRSE